MRLVKIIFSAGLVVLASSISAWAFLSSADNYTPKSETKSNTVKHSKDVFTVSDSDGGSTALVAKNLFPGATKTKDLKFKNNSSVPLSIDVEPKNILSSSFSTAEKFILTIENNRRIVFRGSINDLKKIKVAALPPHHSTTILLKAGLSESANNSDMGKRTRFDISWKANSDYEPPVECSYQKMRARFFIFKRKPVIRLTTRYQARVNGKVAVRFYFRKETNDGFARGEKIASMFSSFKKASDNHWRTQRIRKRITPRLARILRNQEKGFVATLSPKKAPGYCRRYLTVELSTLKRKYGHGQYTWFQKGSFRYR